MPIIEDEIVGSQSDDESKETESNDDLKEIFAMFDIAPKEEADTPAPAIEKEVPKTLKVKHNHGEEEVDISTDEKLKDHIQRSLALDKERERNKQSQTDLDRAAKLLGYKDHAELSAGLDALEQQHKQKQLTEMDELREDMLTQLENNGVDRAQAEKFINNHPLIKKGEEALAKDEKVTAEQAENARWKPLYEAFPEIDKLAKSGDYTWATPELLELAKRNDPLLAYEHLNKGTTIAKTKKATEQQVIKEQQLGLRSRVEINPAPDNEKQVPANLANAFAAFGLPAEAAKKYVK